MVEAVLDYAVEQVMESGVHPSIDVQNQFPNSVSRRQWPGESLVGRNV
jgi:hypothetical protein